MVGVDWSAVESSAQAVVPVVAAAEPEAVTAVKTPQRLLPSLKR